MLVVEYKEGLIISQVLEFDMDNNWILKPLGDKQTIRKDNSWGDCVEGFQIINDEEDRFVVAQKAKKEITFINIRTGLLEGKEKQFSFALVDDDEFVQFDIIDKFWIAAYKKSIMVYFKNDKDEFKIHHDIDFKIEVTDEVAIWTRGVDKRIQPHIVVPQG